MSTILQRRRGHQEVLTVTGSENTTNNYNHNNNHNDDDIDEEYQHSKSPEHQHHNTLHKSYTLSPAKESKTISSPLSPLSSSSPTLRRRRKRRSTSWIGQSLLQYSSMLLFLTAIVLFTANKLYIKSTAPRLPIPHVDISVPNMIDWPLIHIVNTRFMQEQGPLTTLGMARFHLFMTFCFPSMIQQSTQKFFWIIKTDPKFTQSPVFDLLLQAVRPYHNIYVVGSNNNFLIDSTNKPGSWRDGIECMDLLQSKIYTGNITKLRMAMALREERPILETRLDADDGLHKNYIEYIQIVALRRFQPPIIKSQTNNNNVYDESLSSEEKEEGDNGNGDKQHKINES